MLELTHYGNCQWPESSSVNTPISNLLIYSRRQGKKRLRDCRPYSHINSPWDPRKEGQSALFAWFRNTISHRMKRFPVQIFKFLSRSCVRSGIAEIGTHSPLCKHVFMESSLWTGVDTPMHTYKAHFCSRSFHSNGKDTHPWDVIFHACA